MITDRAVVFDVGRVLIDFSFDPFKEFIKTRGASIGTKEEFFDKTNIYAFEKGEVDSISFIETVKSLLQVETKTEEIIHSWKNIFCPLLDMIELCNSLKGKVKTCILSNTNALHWEHLDQHYKVNSLTDKHFTSFDLGTMKPDPKIYEPVEDYLGVPINNILFIDDLPENIAAAEERGWKGVVHKDYLETKKIVLDFLK